MNASIHFLDAILNNLRRNVVHGDTPCSYKRSIMQIASVSFCRELFYRLEGYAYF